MSDAEQLNETFSALAHPARRAMLAQLATGDATVKQLAEPFDISMPAISRHIRILERAGLIIQGQQAQFRPCRLNPAPLRQVASWAKKHQHIWEARFDQMETYLKLMTENTDGNE